MKLRSFGVNFSSSKYVDYINVDRYLKKKISIDVGSTADDR
jgi:hypothetical protein